MYLSDTHVLIGTAALSAVFAVSCIYLLILHRRERTRRLQLDAREELLAGEIVDLETTCDRLRAERAELISENRDLSLTIATQQAAITDSSKQAETHRTMLAATREQLEKDFKILAEQIFTEKGATLSKKHQAELSTLLQPVREQLATFRKKVEDVYDRESRDRVSLVKEIEHLKRLNVQVSEDANSLAKALKGQSKTQGLWGEMILEQLLENSGLIPGREFETQITLKDSRGISRLPDVVVHLPGSRDIVIDAKVSLKDYEKACRAEDPDEEHQHLQAHLDSIKRHVTVLAAKEYNLLEPLNSLDFVLLFLPAEGAFQAAVSREPDLLNQALKKKVVLASPSTLLAILRTINHIWRQDEQNRNSLAIAKQAGSLYDKFVGFVEAFEEIGTRLHQSRDAWETARIRLVSGRGNLISRTETLRELGVQSNKDLPQSVCSDQEENSRAAADDRN